MKKTTAVLLYSATGLAFLGLAQPALAQQAPPGNLNNQINQVQANLQNYIGVVGHGATGVGSEAASNCIALMESDAVAQGIHCPAGTGINVRVQTISCYPVPTTDFSSTSACDCSGTVNIKNPCQTAY